MKNKQTNGRTHEHQQNKITTDEQRSDDSRKRTYVRAGLRKKALLSACALAFSSLLNAGASASDEEDGDEEESEEDEEEDDDEDEVDNPLGTGAEEEDRVLDSVDSGLAVVFVSVPPSSSAHTTIISQLHSKIKLAMEKKKRGFTFH